MLIWDRSHDYVLRRIWNDLTRVTIHFRNSPASVPELMALRRCLPQFREMAPLTVRESIGDTQELHLGELPTREARRLIDAAQVGGLEVITESASFASFLPFDRTTGCAWLIEDEAELAAVVQEMLAAGVPVEDVEA